MFRSPRALAACERSGKLRRALIRRGFDAWSCDLEPADDNANNHIIGDVRDVMYMGWDLMIVCHPPCTRLCRAGQRWLYGPDKTHPKVLPKGRTWADLIKEFEEACDLFVDCMNAPCPHVAIENPEMHKWAKERMPDIPVPQFVQPYWFGDPAFKKTGLHLRGLPELTPTNMLTPPKRGTDEYKQWGSIWRTPPGPNRAKIRSETFDGFAEAAAQQWGDYAMKRLAV
ncbi:hypothetical protein [Ruegeria arenilitoris]|uniref:hypothetical protein n=1 Tax=Ruegeria arenilitoris TaxID=1173585 RepID=UPI00147D20AB|nr:hypothetical protein [Ruegeria arenilitoris]